ncbi:myelin protein zero-like protein 2b [Clarias gariepinus]
MFWIWIRVLLCVLGVLLAPGVHHASAIEVFTSKELTAVNGTDVRLKCTFKSTQPVSETAASVSWSFRPLGSNQEIQFFHYQGEPFLPEEGQFQGHVSWTGNMLKNDGSITLRNVQFTFNGTFMCQVRNPPDVHGYTGEVRFEVVQSVKLSEIGILAAAVGGGIVLVLLILIAIFIVRYFRGRRGDASIELEDSKRGSVW